MSLSSLNRSNSKAFRHILPRIAPICEGMHYHKTGVPWQMNNTFILLILSPYIFSKPCKYWLSSIHTRLFEIIFYLQGGGRNMILLVYHVVSTSNISFFYFFIFVFLYCIKCIYKSFKSFLICTRFPFHNRYSALELSLSG